MHLCLISYAAYDASLKSLLCFVLTCLLTLCGDLVDMPEHSPRCHAVVALFRGYDSVHNLKAVLQLLKDMKLDESLGGINGRVVTVLQKHYLLRVFVEGDHILCYKMAGRDGPTSTTDDCYGCPWCDANAPKCLTYAAEPRMFTKPQGLS